MNLKVCPDQKTKVLEFGLKEKNRSEKLKILNVKDKMAKEKKKKLNILSCKCESGIYGETAVLKNCKCKPVGRKEREYEQVIIEGK